MRVLAGLMVALVVLVAVAALAGPQGSGNASATSKDGPAGSRLSHGPL